MTFKPGDDVDVEFEGEWWQGHVLSVESSGYVLCRIHIDPEWDCGRASPRIDPEQIVAVRQGHVRGRE